MSAFSAEWLALREPHDRAARSRAVLDAVRAQFAGAAAATITDLGCGTGATLRAVSPLLPARQRWRLVDNDPVLLKRAKERAPYGTEVVALDLAQDLETAIGDAPDLVTMSALLDLVSASWLDRLIAAMSRRHCPLYAALSYDGRTVLTPAARHDETVIAAFNRHQLTDKGFGPALGPGAARKPAEAFRRAGFAVVDEPSDWSFDDPDMQVALIEGWTDAAGAMGVAAPILAEWQDERRHLVAAGRSHMRIGHVDLFARPTGRR
jgi:SAM-dependent methyltransferase